MLVYVSVCAFDMLIFRGNVPGVKQSAERTYQEDKKHEDAFNMNYIRQSLMTKTVCSVL